MTKRKYQIKENVFDEINRDSAYWIGYLYGDGNCTTENKIRLCISESDKDLLYKFRNFIGSVDKPVIDFMACGKYPQSRFEIRSWRFHNKLRLYDLTKRKEKRGYIHPDLTQKEVVSDFVRGLFDADGSFYYDGLHKNWLFAEITGYMPVLISLKKVLVSFGVLNENKNITKNGKIYRIRFPKDSALKLISFMYRDKPKYFLKRKYGLAKNYLDRLNETTPFVGKQ